MIEKREKERDVSERQRRQKVKVIKKMKFMFTIRE